MPQISNGRGRSIGLQIRRPGFKPQRSSRKTLYFYLFLIHSPGFYNTKNSKVRRPQICYCFKNACGQGWFGLKYNNNFWTNFWSNLRNLVKTTTFRRTQYFWIILTLTFYELSCTEGSEITEIWTIEIRTIIFQLRFKVIWIIRIIKSPNLNFFRGDRSRPDNADINENAKTQFEKLSHSSHCTCRRMTTSGFQNSNTVFEAHWHWNFEAWAVSIEQSETWVFCCFCILLEVIDIDHWWKDLETMDIGHQWNTIGNSRLDSLESVTVWCEH